MTRLEELIADKMRAELRELKMTPAQRKRLLVESAEYGRQQMALVVTRVRERLAAGLEVPADTLAWLQSKGYQFSLTRKDCEL
jgi:hypothetical protein